jgi:hypothetical protein
MDRAGLVHRRKKRYMAQLLEAFEQDIEPLIPKEQADKFKGTVRRKLHALALDACEVISLKPGEEINGEIIALRDRLHPEGRPIPTRSETA